MNQPAGSVVLQDLVTYHQGNQQNNSDCWPITVNKVTDADQSKRMTSQGFLNMQLAHQSIHSTGKTNFV